MNRDLHRQPNPQVSINEIWNRTDISLIDVRSPDEFSAGHIPGAINIPLLENKERQSIGILYKNFGQEKAIAEGYEILDGKLVEMSNHYQKLPPNNPVVAYCARGGMRSQVVTSFLRYLNFDARQLQGGYKTFRNWNLSQLANFRFVCPIVLYGKTGVGKTLVLDRLENALDLEGMANHRGSIFGGIGKTPVSQKTFEANLLVKLERLDNSKPIYIEGESRKIGDVSIPDPIFIQMKAARAILLEACMATRVQRTITEYIDKQPEALPAIKSTIEQLKKDLGKSPVTRLILLFDQGNYAECFEYILQYYYDKKYAHSLNKIDFIKTISAENLDQACRGILKVAAELTNRSGE
jgi:tRNA 2-selenouridine synthase